MSPKKAGMAIIVISLLFAVGIIVLSEFVQDSENYETLLYTLIALWFVPFAYFSGIIQKKKEDE